MQIIIIIFLWQVESSKATLPQAEHKGSRPEHRILKLLELENNGIYLYEEIRK